MENQTIANKIELLNQRMELELKPLIDIQNDRINRYYNCMDDTLLDGISDKLTSNRIRQIKNRYCLFIEQIKNGGYLHKNETLLALIDFNNNIVSTKIVHTKYGYCFLIKNNTNTKFVSIAKNQKTYEKKGYKCVILNNTYKCKFTGKITENNNFVYSDIELISSIPNFENLDIEFCTSKFDNLSYLQYLINKK